MPSELIAPIDSEMLQIPGPQPEKRRTKDTEGPEFVQYLAVPILMNLDSIQ